MCVYVDGVTLLYSSKLTEHCEPTIMEKIKIIKKKPFGNIRHKIISESQVEVALLWRKFTLIREVSICKCLPLWTRDRRATKSQETYQWRTPGLKST